MNQKIKKTKRKNDPEYHRIYRKNNLERIRELNIEYKNKNKERLKKQRIVYRKKNMPKIKEKVWANKLKARYGLLPSEYYALVDKQMKKCAICGTEAPLSVDHCHDSGKVRGLLCGNCNRGLGLFRDDVTLFQNAINYLKI